MTEEKLHIDDHEEQIKDVVMLAARILLEAGAEGTRTEETMNYIASHYGFLKITVLSRIRSLTLFCTTSLIQEFTE